MSSKGAVSTPNNWPSSEHFGETVTLVVGKEKQPYTFHKGLLCFYSDYFRAAFNGSFREATERKINLPDVEKAVFEAFQVWLYTRKLQIPGDVKKQGCAALTKLWIFADQHQMPLLQNEAMDELFALSARLGILNCRVVDLVYEKTLAGSLLRRAVIDIMAYTMKLEDTEDGALQPDAQKHWSVESIVDLVRVLDKIRKDKSPTFPNLPQRDKCDFHVYAKGERC